MFRLVDAPNTYNAALVVLEQLGCKLTLLVSEDDEMGDWQATLPGATFEASNPLGLLGLVCLWQNKGTGWICDDDPNVYDRLIDEAFPNRFQERS